MKRKFPGMLRSMTHKDLLELVLFVGCWTFLHTLCTRDKVALNALRAADYNSSAAADKMHLLKTTRPYELRYMQRVLQTDRYEEAHVDSNESAGSKESRGAT